MKEVKLAKKQEDMLAIVTLMSMGMFSGMLEGCPELAERGLKIIKRLNLTIDPADRMPEEALAEIEDRFIQVSLKANLELINRMCEESA